MEHSVRIGGDHRARAAVILVATSNTCTGAALYQYRMSRGSQLTNGCRHQAYAILMNLDLFRNADAHCCLPSLNAAPGLESQLTLSPSIATGNCKINPEWASEWQIIVRNSHMMHEYAARSRGSQDSPGATARRQAVQCGALRASWIVRIGVPATSSSAGTVRSDRALHGDARCHESRDHCRVYYSHYSEGADRPGSGCIRACGSVRAGSHRLRSDYRRVGLRAS